jgi:hypothetical protein
MFDKYIPVTYYKAMKKLLTLLSFLIIIEAITIGCNNKNQKTQYYISTQSESNERVKYLHLDKISEDASYILDTNKLVIPPFKHGEAPGDTVKSMVIKEFNRDAILILKSDNHFKGAAVWEVLQNVGLKWGDGDLFHWGNRRRDYGDDQLFSVWTTTDPGYFLPENIKAGQMNPEDLVFGFSIPRNADPENVFSVMINAVKYCQKRLGGKILNEDQIPFNEDAEKNKLTVLINKMRKSGVIPGSDKALITY